MKVTRKKGRKMNVTKEKCLSVIKDISDIINSNDVSSKSYPTENFNNSIAFTAIITALRGPDSSSKGGLDAKWETTAKIRALIGIKSSSNLGVNEDKTPLKLSSLSESGNHFAAHIRSAIRGLFHLGLLPPEMK